jgi:HEPN domain-containing protein
VSREKQAAEAGRWLSTARDDLDAARILLDGRKFAHVCFLAQQAADKAMKAVLYGHGVEPWGHSVRKLIEALVEAGVEGSACLRAQADDAVVLDRFYIPARYPNGLPDLTPAEAHTEADARLALSLASALVAKAAGLVPA